MSCKDRKDYRVPSLALPMDLHSAAGAVPSKRIRLALNCVGRADGTYGRIGGWRKLGGLRGEEHFVFAVIGDYGTDDINSENVANLVKSWKPKFIVSTGDNWYDPHLRNIDQAIGKYYRSYINPYLGAMPLPDGETQKTENAFWAVAGNYDLDVNVGSDFYAYFTTPYPNPANTQWFKAKSGPVEIFGIETPWSTSVNVRPDNSDPNGVQGTWLKQALRDSTALYKIVVFHQPPWTSSSVHYDGRSEMRVTAGWKFGEWGADVLLHGHAHLHEVVKRDGVVSIISGNGGRALYPFNPAAVVGHVAGFDDEFGAVKATVSADGILFEGIDINAVVRTQYAYSRYANSDLHDQLSGVYTDAC